MSGGSWKVRVLHLVPKLRERQLIGAAGWLLNTALEARGQTVLTGADTAEIVGDGQVEGVRLKDGTLIPASLVVMAVGIRPSVALARAAGLAVGRGIQVDDHMVTSDPRVLAVGECVEHDGQVYGLVAPLWDMCRALADGLVAAPSGCRPVPTPIKQTVRVPHVFSHRTSPHRHVAAADGSPATNRSTPKGHHLTTDSLRCQWI